MKYHEIKIILRQIDVMARANMRSRYRKTFAGFIWVIINPMILFAAQSIIFKYFLKLNIEHYFSFMLGGLIPWTFLSSTVLMGTPILQQCRELLKAFNINPFVLVSAQVFDNAVNFLFTYIILLIPMLIWGGASFIGIVFFPLAFILMLLSLGSFVWILSVFQIFLRDTSFVIAFVLNVMFFLTPIFYSKDFIPEGYRWLLNFNIFYIMIEPFRISVHRFDYNDMFLALSKGAILAGILLFISVKVWRKFKNEFYAKL
jgi:lipopolysaccharide transport system permease protein